MLYFFPASPTIFVLTLLANTTSPYARKVRIALAEKKFEYQLQELSPWTGDNPVHAFNPLGKIPVLVLDDGTNLFDSRVIVEYLDLRHPDVDWRGTFGNLVELTGTLSKRPSFAETGPPADA